MTKKHDILWLDSAKSTNDVLRMHIDDIDNLSVVSVREQTAGRGQRGNSWSSEPGANLTFSILLKEDQLSGLTATGQSILNEIASLSIVDFLASHGISAKIKWPNDIYVDSRKICGVLIENSVKGNKLAHSIIGIGLNINQRNFDVNIPNPTSMSLCTGKDDYDIEKSLEEFMDIFETYVDRFLNIRGGYMKTRQLYLSQMWMKDVECEFIDRRDNERTGRQFTGIIRNLSEFGNLMIEDVRTGETYEFGFKEIEYVISL